MCLSLGVGSFWGSFSKVSWKWGRETTTKKKKDQTPPKPEEHGRALVDASTKRWADTKPSDGILLAKRLSSSWFRVLFVCERSSLPRSPVLWWSWRVGKLFVGSSSTLGTKVETASVLSEAKFNDINTRRKPLDRRLTFPVQIKIVWMFI